MPVWNPLGAVTGAVRAGQIRACFLRASALSTLSHVKSGSSLPKWPKRAYVSLVELARDKRQAEQRLRMIRIGPKKEDPGPSPKDEEQRKKEAELRKQREEAEEAQRRKIEDDASEGSCEEDDEEEDFDVEEDSDLENPAVSVPMEDENEHPQECRAIVPVPCL